MLKRIIDCAVSIILLITLLPVFLIVCILIKMNLGSPIFFRQNRPGLNGLPFEMIKFRTMANSSPELIIPDSERLNRFGKLLRVLSVDELPELWNVLKGDMSLVGPRPLLMEYLPLYSPEQFRRHKVKPGITGWAQINGRNAISWDEKFKLDLWYIENHTVILDLKILIATLKKVFLREGISASDHVTIEKFSGSMNE